MIAHVLEPACEKLAQVLTPAGKVARIGKV
jgi:hypothetical protein